MTKEAIMINTTKPKLFHLSYAPRIPGLVFRRFRGEVDYPHMVAVLEGSREEDKIEWLTSLEDIRLHYAHLDNCDPFKDMLFIEMNGQVIGYTRVTWWQESQGDMIYHMYNYLLPAWRGKGIRNAILLQNEERLLEISQDHQQPGGRFFDIWVKDTETHLVQLLEKNGYIPARFGVQMIRSLSIPIEERKLPPGLEIRPVEETHLRLIMDAMNEAFRDHWGHSELTEEEYKQWVEDHHNQPELWKIAWDGDQVAGVVLNYILPEENKTFNRLRGWTDPICVRRPWRKRGLAKALIAASLQELKNQGMEEAALDVDTENPNDAYRLYESMEYQRTDSFTTYRKTLVQWKQ